MEALPNVSEIKEVAMSLGKKYGAERIFLFGSYARGEADEKSDIDLRIDKGSVRGLQMGALLVEMEDALGKNVDLLSTKCLEEPFLTSIREEEILLYER